MPIYEYRCEACQKTLSLYLPRYPQNPPNCPECGQPFKRRFSTFSIQRGFRDTYDDILSDGQLTKGLMNNDARALAEWNRRMSGGEKPAPEYQETLDRLEHGELPSPPADS